MIITKEFIYRADRIIFRNTLIMIKTLTYRYTGLVDYIIKNYKSSIEIGIGHFPDVAIALYKKGVRVFATDIRKINYREIKVIVDDITKPNISLYKSVDLIYSLRPPSELIPYMVKLAKEVFADLIIKPLMSEYIDGKLIKNGSTIFFLWEYYEEEKRQKKKYP